MLLYLAPHVYACQANGHIVCLDVKRDKYIRVGAAEARTLSIAVTDWPVGLCVTDASTRLSANRTQELIQRWTSLGMLTSSAPTQPRIHPVASRALQSFTDEQPGIRPNVRSHDITHLAYSAARATFLRRTRSFEELLLWARARRTASPDPLAPERFTEDEDRQSVEAFLYFRSLYYRVRRHCLFDSLVLLDFLAGRGLHPQWVFGVRMVPFHAHCWLQEGTIVFNDAPDHVRHYTPILAV